MLIRVVIRNTRHKEDEETCFGRWVQIGCDAGAVCPTSWSWETSRTAQFGTLEPKGCSLIVMKCIGFTNDTGKAGLAIIPTNCGCLRCHRPFLYSKVELWYLASPDLFKSSLLLLLPAAPATCVSPFGYLRSQPQNSTCRASGSQQCVKAFTCLQDSFGLKVHYRSIRSYISCFFIFQALKKEQD